MIEKIYNQFDKALKERDNRGHFAEITFIGINSAKIKDHKRPAVSSLGPAINMLDADWAEQVSHSPVLHHQNLKLKTPKNNKNIMFTG